MGPVDFQGEPFLVLDKVAHQVACPAVLPEFKEVLVDPLAEEPFLFQAVLVVPSEVCPVAPT